MYQALTRMEREKIAVRLLLDAAARFGAMQKRAAAEMDLWRAENAVRIVITDAGRGMPYLVPGEVYETHRGFRDWRGRPVFYVWYMGRPRMVYASECQVLEEA